MKNIQPVAQAQCPAPTPFVADYRPISPALKVDGDACVLQIRDMHRRAGDSHWRTIRVGECWLPDPANQGRPVRISERPDVFWTIAATVDSYLSRRKATKSTSKVAAALVTHLVKTFEYACLRGYFRLSDLPAEEWQRLKESLAAGGWVNALEIESRTVNYLRLGVAKPTDMLDDGHGRHAKSVRVEALLALATNIYGRELVSVREILVQAVARPELEEPGSREDFRRRNKQRMSVGGLTSYLAAINTLADAPEPYGLRTVPIPQARRFAVARGAPDGRTPNIAPEPLAALLTHSYKWILELGPLVCALVRALSFHVAALHHLRSSTSYTEASWRQVTHEIKLQVFRRLEEKQELEQVLGLRIDSFVTLQSRSKESTSLNAVLNQLYTACFVILSLMNARRKDEVLGSAIGLHASSMRVLDEELELAECDFYIEKTVHAPVPFLINRISQSAVAILGEISEMAWSVAEASGYEVNPQPEGRKLFVYPNFANGQRASEPVWYRFSAVFGGQALGFVREALPNSELTIRGHMFRRAYGTVYMYRYELAELIALSQKYEHREPAMTLIYVTDSESTPAGKTLAASWSLPKNMIRQVHQEHQAEVEKMVADAARERLKEFIREVVHGSATYSGGFVRLVSRFHKKLQGRLDYSILDSEAKTQVVFRSLDARGHAPHPYWYTTCMAGRYRHRAACGRDGALAREDSSPVTCSKCPYSSTSRVHLAALVADEKVLTITVHRMPESLLRRKKNHDLKLLRRVIELHERRLVCNE